MGPFPCGTRRDASPSAVQTVRKTLWIGILALSFVQSARSAVEIEGLDPELEAQVRGHLDLGELDCDAPHWMVRWLFRNAGAQARRGLEAVGYYDPTIEMSLDLGADCWTATLEVTPGDVVTIAAVDLEIPPEVLGQKRVAAAADQLQALVGAPLQHEAYETAKRRLINAALDRGYLEAKYSVRQVDVNVETDRAVVHLALDAGPRYRFGEITVIGDVIGPELMKAYMPFKPGDPYDGTQLTKLRRSLIDSDYFNRVIVAADADQAVDLAVPVRIEVTPPSRNWAYSVGVGYATDTGPRLRAGATDRLRNKRGHRAEARALASKVASGVDLSYSIPHRDPPDDWITFDIGYAHEDSDTVRSDRQRYGVRHTYPLGDWIRTDFTDLTYEDYTIANEDADSRLVVFGTTFDIGDSNSPVRPTSGYRFTGTVRGAAQALGSDTDFAQTRVFVGFVQGLTTNLRMLVRFNAGWSIKQRFDELPPSVRFFAGGDNSIRGYGYQKVGEEQDGEVVGGERLLTGSFELDYAIREQWSLAAFVDSGSAFNNDPDFKTGAGVGLRWYSPIGPVRLDLAHPFEDNRNVRVHLSIGPDI